MKKIAYLLVLLMCFSCSDEETALATPEPEVQKLPLVSKITVLKNGALEEVFEFTYDAKNRMERLSYNEGINAVQYTYNEANLVTRVLFNDNPNHTVDFHYNAQNIPTSYEHQSNGFLLPVTYDEATNFYTFGPNHYILNAIGDVKSTTRVHYSYNDKKGMFANVVGPNIMMINALIGLFVSAGSKVAMETVYNDDAQMFDIKSTYNEAGYPVKVDYTGLLPLHPNRTFILEY